MTTHRFEMQKLPKQVVKEAILATKAGNFTLDKILSSKILRIRDWDYCFIGWSYLKCVDNLIDEDQNEESAMAHLASQRDFIDEIYATDLDQSNLNMPEKFGYYIFSYDKRNNSPLRPMIHSMLEEMEFDIRRRNRIVPHLQLENYAIKMGEATIKYYGYFISRNLELPRSFIEQSSLAYVWADSLIDIEEDLRVGIINIPEEDIKHSGLQPTTSDERFPQWLRSKSKETFEHFEKAFRETGRLRNPAMKILTYLYLTRKRNSLRRYMNRVLKMNGMT